jgi:DNA-binding response OmpR family regulator
MGPVACESQGHAGGVTIVDERGSMVMEQDVRAHADSPDRPRPIALVADDDPGVRVLLAEVLDEMGLETFTASNGLELMELAERMHPSLIIVDVMMPRMDGYTAVARLRGQATTERVPIIVLTGRGDPSFKALSDGMGANAHLTKPFVPRALADAVRALLPGLTA